MILNDYYWFFQSALTDDQCDAIIERGQQEIDWVRDNVNEKATIAQTGGRASVYNLGDQEPRTIPAVSTKEEMRAQGIDVADTFTRDSTVSFFQEPWVYDLLHPYLQTANEHSGWNFEISHSEQTQFTQYNAVGEGGQGQFYGWHVDGQWAPYKLYDPDNPQHQVDALLRDENNKPIQSEAGGDLFVDNTWTTQPEWVGKVRKLSMTVQLTKENEYEGGLFQIDRGPHYEHVRYYTVSEIATRGSIIVFPSFVHHQVTPVTRGTRESLVMWSLGTRWT
jgi:predicted 2-oxoglutarate/Fe(II)-dependent dioxygenase YbiX